MDARRFPSRQDAESENPLERLSRELLLPRGKPLSLVTFFAAAKKVTRPRSGRKRCFARTRVHITCASQSISGCASRSNSSYGMRTASVCEPALNMMSACPVSRESTNTGMP